MRAFRIFLAFVMLFSALPSAVLAAFEPADVPKTDLYYHENPACAARTDREEDPEAKFPCPVCVPEEIDGEPSCVERGGTYVLRIPDKWMASRPEKEIHGVFAGTSVDEYRGEAGQEKLAELLHGAEYNDFLADYAANGYAETRVFTPTCIENGLVMNLRHIGGAWYLTMHEPPEEIYLRFFTGDMWMENDTLHVHEYLEWGDYDYELKPVRKSDRGAAFEAEYIGFDIAIYDEMDTKIVVVHEWAADRDLLENARLIIGAEAPVMLNGYMNGDQGVFCGVLTDAEAAAIADGETRLIFAREDFLDGADYCGTHYAVVRKGTGGVGVVDLEQNFVIGPGYREIQRQGNIFFCREEGGDIAVIDMDRNREIARVECTDSNNWIHLTPCNGAVFAVQQREKGEGPYAWTIYSLETGEIVRKMTVGEPDAPTYSSSGGLNGSFGGPVSGTPGRLIFWGLGENDARHAWLADNSGNRITKNFDHIEGLAWIGEKGYYVVSTYDPAEHTGHPNNSNKYYEGYDGREWFGPSWRCGVIDQNGNALTEVEFVKIEFDFGGNILLTREDGTTQTLQIME